MPQTAKKRVSLRKLSILALLGEPGEPIIGRTRLQKLLFLIQDRLAKDGILEDSEFLFDYAYEPEKFGPADIGLYQDLDFLQAMQLISIDGSMGLTQSGVPTLDSARVIAKGAASLPEEDEEDELSFEYLMGQKPEEYYVAESEDSDTETSYELTTNGLQTLKRIRDGLANPTQVDRFDRVIKTCAAVRSEYGQMHLKSLLRFVYKTYPKMTTRSVIKGQVLSQF